MGRSGSLSQLLVPSGQRAHGTSKDPFPFESKWKKSRSTGTKIAPRRLSVVIPSRAGRKRSRGMQRKRANSHSFGSSGSELTMLEEIRRFYAPAGLDISAVARDDTSFYSDKAL